jgi:hypothetical protein
MKRIYSAEEKWLLAASVISCRGDVVTSRNGGKSGAILML